MKVAALERCVSESGLDALNQGRYGRWRDGLDDPASVPSQFAFGDAAEFVAFCREHGVAVTATKSRVQSASPVYMSDRQIRAVAERFVAETPGPYARGEYDRWRRQLSEAGDRLPSWGTIENRVGSLEAALPEGEQPESRAEIIGVAC